MELRNWIYAVQWTDKAPTDDDGMPYRAIYNEKVKHFFACNHNDP